jgi:hypothetical protein
MIKYITKAGMLGLSALTSLRLLAQNKGLDIDIDVNKKEWYEQPWAMITGGAIILILIVLAVRKRK